MRQAGVNAGLRLSTALISGLHSWLDGRVASQPPVRENELFDALLSARMVNYADFQGSNMALRFFAACAVFRM